MNERIAKSLDSYYMGNFFPANKNGRMKFSFRGKKVGLSHRQRPG